MNEHDFDVVEAMERFGGSFVQSLAKACHHADPNNLAKIKSTWPEYWEEYSKLAERSKENKNHAS